MVRRRILGLPALVLGLALAAGPVLAASNLVSVVRGGKAEGGVDPYTQATLTSANDRDWVLTIEGCRMTVRPSLAGLDAGTRAHLEAYRDGFAGALTNSKLLLFAMLEPTTGPTSGDNLSPRCDPAKLYTVAFIDADTLPPGFLGVSLAEFSRDKAKGGADVDSDGRDFIYFFSNTGLGPQTREAAASLGPVTQAVVEAALR